jgi:hypothetical protein
METALQQLVATLGDAVRSDPVTCENYRFDWSRDPTAGVPMAVVRPLTAAEVQTAVRWAAQHRVPVVPRGAGTSLSGGALPLALVYPLVLLPLGFYLPAERRAIGARLRQEALADEFGVQSLAFDTRTIKKRGSGSPLVPSKSDGK